MKGFVMLWFASLILVAVASAWVSGQVIMPRKIDPPIVVSGSEFGFRIEAREGATAIGRLLVRIDGRWVEADISGGPRRLTN